MSARQRKPSAKKKANLINNEIQTQTMDSDTASERGQQSDTDNGPIGRSIPNNGIQGLIQMMEKLFKQNEIITQQNAGLVEQLKARTIQYDMLAEQVASISQELKELRAQIKALTPPNTPPSPTYAEIARTPPVSQQITRSTLPTRNSGQEYHEVPYCTIDTSKVGDNEKNKVTPGAIRQAIEKEMEGVHRAVIKDPKNANRIRVYGQSEGELAGIREALQKGVSVPGARIMRDQLYPIKIDNANKSHVLDQEGNIKEGAIDALGKENGIQIAKIAWLSDKTNHKLYGSMVIYLTKAKDANFLLQKQFFELEGESAYTRMFEPKVGPIQCYNCQALGHKAFACKQAQKCANCTEEGHNHRECMVTVSKCTLCEGPHPSYSKNCPKLYPKHG